VRSFGTALAPWQVRTFRVDADPGAPIVETDLLESPLPDVHVRVPSAT
jgi:hypothetical protein